MNSVIRIQKLLLNDPNVKRFKELEQMIDQNKQIQQKYQELLQAQKHMVQLEATRSKKYEEAKQCYQTQKKTLMEFLVMEEYLDLLEVLNNDLNMIQNIIEEEIKSDFD